MDKQLYKEDRALFWVPLQEFIVHTVVGVAVFVIIACFAVGMNYVREWLDLEGFVATGLKGAEVLILVLDSLLLLVFLIRTNISFFLRVLLSFREDKNGSR
jgi:hypothetical protein